MIKKILLPSIFCAFFPLITLAVDKTITCQPPLGTRVDYFSHNTLNLKSHEFLMGRDQVAGMQPQIILGDNRTVSFIIGDATELKSQPKAGNMQVLLYNEEQISFAGIINNAPILATYYPKLSILIYSQQSIWPGPNYQGARAVMFYSKCQ